MARIVLCGYMLRFPVPGNVLAYFQYLLGLSRLGHQVVYLEESGWPYGCYDPATREWEDHPTAGLRIVRELAASTAVTAPICYVNRQTGAVTGAEWNVIKSWLSGCDALLNVGGVCWLPEFNLAPVRAIIDMDPLFTQVGQFAAKVLGDYHVHYTYGTSIGRTGCTIPTMGFDWKPLVPPVVADWWPLPETVSTHPFTTIANWSAYGGLEHEGERYGQKDEEFKRFISLPSRTTQPLELTISGAGEDVLAMLAESGWRVREGGTGPGVDLASYRDYIAQSRGEFSVAKNAYVKTRSGWVSDRTVCYLASGLPAVVQDTGFRTSAADGRGLLMFSTLDQAVECLERVNAHYEEHRSAASRLAVEAFNYDVVLGPMVDQLVNRSRIHASPGVGR